MGKKSLRADNKTAENCHRIAVDYFTKKEYDEFPAELEVIFEDNEIAYDDVGNYVRRGHKLYALCVVAGGELMAKMTVIGLTN